MPQRILARDSYEGLGALQAVSEFCAKIDPAHAYDKQADVRLHGLTPEQRMAIRGRSQYKAACKSLTSNASTLKACIAILDMKPNDPS